MTEATGWGGRVAIGHATKLSAMPPADFEAAAKRLADAGVAVTVLPATDLFLTGRDHDHNVPRGVTSAHKLRALGVNANISTNNVLNPFTPFGDVSLIRMINLYANVMQVGAIDDLAGCLDLVTSAPANAAQPEALRHCRRQSRRSRGARLRDQGRGGMRDRAAAVRFQERHQDLHQAGCESAQAPLKRASFCRTETSMPINDTLNAFVDHGHIEVQTTTGASRGSHLCAEGFLRSRQCADRRRQPGMAGDTSGADKVDADRGSFVECRREAGRQDAYG